MFYKIGRISQDSVRSDGIRHDLGRSDAIGQYLLSFYKFARLGGFGKVARFDMWRDLASGEIWRDVANLTRFDAIWQYFLIFDRARQGWAKIDTMWRNLTGDRIWQGLSGFDYMWRYLALIDRSCQDSTRDQIWQDICKKECGRIRHNLSIFGKI